MCATIESYTKLLLYAKRQSSFLFLSNTSVSAISCIVLFCAEPKQNEHNGVFPTTSVQFGWKFVIASVFVSAFETISQTHHMRSSAEKGRKVGCVKRKRSFHTLQKKAKNQHQQQQQQRNDVLLRFDNSFDKLIHCDKDNAGEKRRKEMIDTKMIGVRSISHETNLSRYDKFRIDIIFIDISIEPTI